MGVSPGPLGCPHCVGMLGKDCQDREAQSRKTCREPACRCTQRAVGPSRAWVCSRLSSLGKGTGRYASRLLPRECCLLWLPRGVPGLLAEAVLRDSGQGPRCGVDGVRWCVHMLACAWAR